ncbi:MAG: diguanylate cyclase [Candidatus Omnitrophica bacterium]|nr:diguanylate cyclase [Candidatus Omnitrophota bacterium]
MAKINLQGRLIILMVVFCIIFIAIFTSIQVYNQLSRSIDFNYYKARTGALLLQLNINHAIREIPPENLSQRNQKIKEVINALYSSGVIGDTLIFTKNYETIYSTSKFLQLGQKDKETAKEIFAKPSSDEKIYPYVDKQARAIKLFIPVQEGLLVRVEYDLGNLYKAINEVYIPIMITIIAVIAANIFLALLLSRTIISPISILNTVTSEVAAGNLDRHVNIKTGDELEELANTFNYMTVELKKMKQKAENANPLTKLPGNIVIREEVEKRIKNNEKFMVIYCDLDNFKAFNDKYGIEAGDKAIQLTAEIFKEVVAKKGKAPDFVGHEGGDDFLILTRPERAKDMADYIILEFDKRVRQFYSKEDLEKGFIEAKSRQGETMKFPIMTISLAGVTNEIRPITSYGEVTNIAAEVKKKVKSMQQSCLFIDQRKAPFPAGMPLPK